MANKRQRAQQQLGATLARTAPARAADLARVLDISVPTLHRLLAASAEPILVAGRARRTRYALRRPLRGDDAPIPIYAIDETGQPHQLAELALIQPHGCHADLTGSQWPLNAENRDGWWAGLPYPLYDMRPQGYLGRQLAQQVQDTLAVSANPNTWTDDDTLWVLSRMGADLPGNLIVGEGSYRRWQDSCLNSPPILAESEIGPQYTQAAEQAISLGIAGSSAAGEFPKFTALRTAPGAHTPHVIVKFSAADPSPAVRRWADLLVAEHLALAAINRLPGATSPASCIRQHQGRVFLEVERFDRHGLDGRSPVVTLETLNAEFLGQPPGAWETHADKLGTAGLLAGDPIATSHRIAWFGRLIANNDMHLGNLAFRPCAGSLQLCPIYDMLPMAYAPLPGGELPRRAFRPPMPLPPQHAHWLTACRAAIHFWLTVAGDERISSSLRDIAHANADELERRAQLITG